jgi:hypothetical protein
MGYKAGGDIMKVITRAIECSVMDFFCHDKGTPIGVDSGLLVDAINDELDKQGLGMVTATSDEYSGSWNLYVETFEDSSLSLTAHRIHTVADLQSAIPPEVFKALEEIDKGSVTL